MRILNIVKASVGSCVILATLATFAVPASADFADDVARAEMEIALREVAREIVANAHDRATAAAHASSLGQKTLAALRECNHIAEDKTNAVGVIFERHGIATNIDGWPRSPKWRRHVPLGVTGRELLDEATAVSFHYDARFDACSGVALVLHKDLVELEATLFDSFLEDESQSHIEAFFGEAERGFLEREVENRAVEAKAVIVAQ